MTNAVMKNPPTMRRLLDDATDARAGIAHLSEDDRHRLLASERRRATLSALAGRTAPVELAVLATEVADREARIRPTDEEAVDRVSTTLHHVHLPALDAADVIDYSAREARVESCPPHHVTDSA